MKKLLLFTISIFTLLSFSACSSGMDNFKDEAEITSLTGVLMEKERENWQYKTQGKGRGSDETERLLFHRQEMKFVCLRYLCLTVK